MSFTAFLNAKFTKGTFQPSITTDYLKMFAFVLQKIPKKEDHMVTKTCRSMRKKNFMRIKKILEKYWLWPCLIFLRNDEDVLKFE